MTDDKEDWTPIRIEAPIPLGVAGALMQAIGTIWPDSVIETDERFGGNRYALNMRVPNKPPADLDQEFVDQLRKESSQGDGDFTFLGFREGWVAFAPPEELMLELGNIAHTILMAYPEEVVNHLEWSVTTGHDPDDPRYVLSISRSKEQTPLAMRKAAEEELATVKKDLAKHKKLARKRVREYETELARLQGLLDANGVSHEGA